MIVAIVLTLVALVGLGVAWEWLFRRTSERSAIEDTGRSATDTGRAVLDPFITDDLLAGRTDAIDKVAIAGLSLIHDRGAVHVEIWSEDGMVLWADQTALIGRTFQLEDEERALFLSQGAIVESRQVTLGVATGDANLLHVDFGSTTISGVPVMVEIDYPLSLVQTRAAQGRRSFRPMLFIALGLLVAAQLPLLRALAQRRNALEAQRAYLVRRFITTGDAERRRIAAEVHDGAVQDLIGIALSLSVAADEVASPMKEHLVGISDATRRTVRNLRSLLINIYPVEVPADGWVGGLDATVEALRQRGIVVDVDVQDIQLAPADALLMLRVGREALRNISSHAEASRVEIVMRQVGTTTTLRV
ncbi:MAG: two-component system, NarL family, sensor kinase, partial [Ilumatobacteraceae bacterium]